MTLDLETYRKMYWHRFNYFLRKRELSLYRLGLLCDIRYEYMRTSKWKKLIPIIPRAIQFADIFGISLEELCDPRIPVGEVKVEPIPDIFTTRDTTITRHTAEFFEELCNRDTDTLRKKAEEDRKVNNKVL